MPGERKYESRVTQQAAYWNRHGAEIILAATQMIEEHKGEEPIEEDDHGHVSYCICGGQTPVHAEGCTWVQLVGLVAAENEWQRKVFDEIYKEARR